MKNLTANLKDEETPPPRQDHAAVIYNNALYTANLKDEETPPPRQDHAAVIYNNALYIHGGLGLDNKIFDDLWKYFLLTLGAK